MAAKPKEDVNLKFEIELDQMRQEIADYEAKVAILKSEVTSLKREKTNGYKETERLRELLDMVQSIEGKHTTKAPAWAVPKKKPKNHEAIVSLLLSDLHLDEVVVPEEIEGLNVYNREIAEMRMERCVERTISLSRNYISGVHYAGMELMLGGDLISGFIHEELAETNEAPIPETVDYWLNPLASAIGAFADEYGQVHVSGVVGNHGRLHKKPRAKQRVTSNIDWLIYRMLMRDFKDDSRITWQIPYSADTTVKVYDTDYLFTHGDQFKGGSGIAGLLSPMMTGVLKKSKRAMLTDQPFDYLVMGHWHQYSTFKNIIVNGSLKGMDEYAYIGNFDYEPAQQAFWITTPENGITISAPVLVENRKAEGWA